MKGSFYKIFCSVLRLFKRYLEEAVMESDFKGKRLLNVKETAKLLGLSPQSIYNTVCRKAKKRFPIVPIRIGKNIRFDIEDIEAYINSEKSRA